MSFAITGLTNANEFYSQHYLDEILEKDLKSLFEQWKEQGAQSPVVRLRTAAGANGYFRARERFLTARKTSERASLFIDLVQPLLAALGYDLAPQNLTLADGELPVLAVYRDAKQHPLLVIAAAIADAEDDDCSPLQLLPPATTEQGKSKHAHSDWEETLSKRLFADDHPPRWVLLVHHEEWLLIERSKWGRKALLRFNLPDLFGPRDDHQFRCLAALAGSQSVLPAEGGVALLDSLDESSHKHAFEVSTDLKYALRECIELIANEAIRYKREVAKEKLFERNDLDLAEQLSRESLRYMYRLLFMFYIEARPELGYAPIDAEAYLKGYSVEHLRELEQTQLTTSEAQEGFYFHDSLKQLFSLIWQGYPRRDAGASQLDLTGAHDGLLDIDWHNNGFTIAPLQGHLFDPARTPLLGSVRLRNSVLQRVIELMSLSRGGGKRRRGRISYGTLGINQLGAVYESLLSFRGFFAEEELFEVRPDPSGKKTAAADSDGDDNEEGDGSESDAQSEDDLDTCSAADKSKDAALDPLAAAYFVPASSIGQYTDAERLFGGEPRRYAKGTFIYRLAGRAREKSASYYTPEVLTKCLVEHALKEILPGKLADDILQITVCEPAMGSAAFLNEAVSQLAEAYLQAKQKELGQTIPHESYTEEKQRVKMYIADNNVFGVDLNPVAVELAEVSLWLNAIFKGSHVPWFGLQLYNGNSLVGARREVFTTAQLSPGKGENGQPERDWRAAAPRAVPFPSVEEEQGERKPWPASDVFHFLLPAEGMGMVSDKVVKALEPAAFEQFKQWRKAFTAPLTKDEVKRVQALSAATEQLWQQHAKELARVRAATCDELHVWPDPAANRAPTSTAQKDAAYQREMLSEAQKNASPYRRLKLVMDAWCALWFWPLDKAAELPSREHWWFVLETVLLGSASLASTAADELFPETQLQQGLDFTPERDKHNYVDIAALIEALPQLQVAQQVAGQQHFMHWELEFADQFFTLGGFDLVIGNPPWIAVSWDESGFFSEFDPRLALRRFDAAEIAEARIELFKSYPAAREAYWQECLFYESVQSFLQAEQNYSLIAGQKANLYKNFVMVAWRLARSAGVSGLIHEDGFLDAARGEAARRAIYLRLRLHANFVNEKRLFPEVHHEKEFSLNIYGGGRSTPNFVSISNLYAVSSLSACLGDGPQATELGTKNESGSWNIGGSTKRALHIDSDRLLLIASIFDAGCTDPLGSRLPKIQAAALLSVLKKISSGVRKLGDIPGTRLTQLFDENAFQKSGHLKKGVGFVPTSELAVLSGSHIFLANSFYKHPFDNYRNHNHFGWVDLAAQSFSGERKVLFRVPRDFEADLISIAGTIDDGKRQFSDEYRLAFREMVQPTRERTLVGAIICPRDLHVDTVGSIYFPRRRDLLISAALFNSIVFDFIVKSTGSTHIKSWLVDKLPCPDCKQVERGVEHRLLWRALRLNCLSAAYAELWREAWADDFLVDTWSVSSSRLQPISYAA